VIEFLLGFLIQLLAGQVAFSEISAIDNTNTVPQVETRAEWLCGEETCFIQIGEYGVHTGP
jgi:hypothetical protein